MLVAREVYFATLRELDPVEDIRDGALSKSLEAGASQRTWVDSRKEHWSVLFCRLAQNASSTTSGVLHEEKGPFKPLIEALIAVELACGRVDWALRVHNNEECPEFVYHYTKKKTFDDVFLRQLSNSGNADKGLFLRLHPAESLNDPSEGGLLYECLEMNSELKGLDELGFFDFARRNRNLAGLSHRDPTTFLASFCHDIDNLNLWRFYGDEGHGVCVGFPARSCFQVNRNASEIGEDEGLPLYQVRYGRERTNEFCKALIFPLSLVASALRSTEKALGRSDDTRLRQETWRAALSILNDVAFFFKADAYAEEREFRVIHRAEEGLGTEHFAEDEGTLFFESEIPVFCRSRESGVRGDASERRTITLGPQYSKNAGLDQVRIRRLLDLSGRGETTTIYLSEHTYRTNLQLKD